MEKKIKSLVIPVGLGVILIITLLSLLYRKEILEKDQIKNQSSTDLTWISDPSYHIPPKDAFQSSLPEVNSDFDVDIAQVIDDYSEWAKFPPDSRPLHPSHVDVLYPRTIPVSLQEMPLVKGGEIKNSGYSCQLQPEFHTVTEANTLRIFLVCYKSGTDRRQSLNIDEVKIEGKAGKNSFYPPSISGNDSGFDGDIQARDLVYTFHFRPRNSDWGDMSMTVQFSIVGDESKSKHQLTHHFFSSPIAPAKFSGKFFDRLEEGSLYIDVEILVSEPGMYTIEANLMSESEEPIGYSRRDKKLMSGRQIVTLQFFGKIIVLSKESGPYRLTNVRGTLNTDVIQEDLLTKSPVEVDRILRNISDDRPKHKTIPYYEGIFLTNSYTLSEFSEKDFDSPEKRQRLADLKMLLK